MADRGARFRTTVKGRFESDDNRGVSADAWSFEAEILRHLDSVYRVALWLSGDPTEAHDLTQATYEHALRARPRFVPENPRGWLLTILRHVFLNVRRHQAIVVEVPLEDHEAAMATPIANLPPGLVRADIEAALDKLPGELRLPLLMADVEGLSMAEIAEALGWPVGTVKSRLWRARTRLGMLLREYAEGRAPRPGGSELPAC